VEEMAVDNYEEKQEDTQALEKIENILMQITNILTNDTLTTKRKMEELENINENLKEDYRNHIKSTVRNITILRILDKIDKNDLMLLDKDTIQFFIDILNKYQKIATIISLIEKVSNSIVINKSEQMTEFIFSYDKIIIAIIEITIYDNEKTLQVLLSKNGEYGEELIKVSADKIEHIESLDALYNIFDQYISSIKHLLAYYYA
jgi:hypothetical protein